MEMPPVHMCAYLNEENRRLKEKIVNLKRQRAELEEIASRRSCDHIHTCSISCQTDIDVRPRRNSSSNDEIKRLQRLLQSQNELLKKYETNDQPHSNDFHRQLKQSHDEKQQAEKRAELAEARLAKLEERYERMRREMSVLDENFFNEIEDLKYALHQANQLNREYEKTVQMLGDRLGISHPSIRPQT